MRLVKDDEGRVCVIGKLVQIFRNDEPGRYAGYHPTPGGNIKLRRELNLSGMRPNDVDECLEWLEGAKDGWAFSVDTRRDVVTVKVIDEDYCAELPEEAWPGIIRKEN